MAFAPSAFWNSRSITHLANYLSPSLPMNSSDESNDLRRQHRRGTYGHDLVVIAVQNERWHVELLEIFGEIRLGKRLDAVEHGVVASHAMTEDHRLSRTPVLVVNLRAVLCRDYAHKISPWFFSAANYMDG